MYKCMYSGVPRVMSQPWGSKVAPKVLEGAGSGKGTQLEWMQRLQYVFRKAVRKDIRKTERER